MHYIILFLFILINTGCGFHFQKNIFSETEKKELQLNSNKQYSYFIKTLIEQLKIKNFDLSKTNRNTPILNIINFFEDTRTLSIFCDGKAAEKQLIFTINTELIINNNKFYKLNNKIERTFFENNLKALAKDTEKDTIMQEMQEEAIHNLIHNLLFIYSHKK
ncbi:LPS assembly lipoprotein LptE [Candidatus Providencia siddallii]|uniref:LPS-assembly lipoprotein LptE, partial n=1 Tax=Candidatus Providencia siddallii TaxID=1715285 RepID=A0ABM9NNE8_9GAMM